MTSLIRKIIGNTDHPPTVDSQGVRPRPTPGVTATPAELDREIMAAVRGEGIHGA